MAIHVDSEILLKEDIIAVVIAVYYKFKFKFKFFIACNLVYKLLCIGEKQIEQ